MLYSYSIVAAVAATATTAAGAGAGAGVATFDVLLVLLLLDDIRWLYRVLPRIVVSLGLRHVSETLLLLCTLRC